MTKTIEDLEKENQDLRKYISLLLGEIEFANRVSEIRSNFGPEDAEKLCAPILERMSRLRNERILLESELELKS